MLLDHPGKMMLGMTGQVIRRWMVAGYIHHAETPGCPKYTSAKIARKPGMSRLL